MTEPILPPLKPIPMKDRVSVLFVEKGNLDVLDGAFVIVDKTGVRTHIPVGGVACLMLEPGTRVSHAAVTLASRVGCLLVWIGDGGVVDSEGHGRIVSDIPSKHYYSPQKHVQRR